MSNRSPFVVAFQTTSAASVEMYMSAVPSPSISPFCTVTAVLAMLAPLDVPPGLVSAYPLPASFRLTIR